ncbi:MAG: choice-of-anchor R domain-containing protein, partial [Capsulimonadales bacterium]|nr:choice-of-anchor R domain-containing protein [Capsulimonadales bacterium]
MLRNWFVCSLSCAAILAAPLSQARAQALIDNFAAWNGSSAGFLSLGTGNYLAQSFVAGPTGASKADVTIRVNSATPGDIQLAVYDDVAGHPGQNLSGFVSRTRAYGAHSVYANVLTGTGASRIEPNRKYWLVLRSSTQGSSAFG